jgi:SAM-dependent methyltransferase
MFLSDLITSWVSIIGTDQSGTLLCLSILQCRQWGDSVKTDEWRLTPDTPRPQFLPDYAAFATRHDLADWEGWWSPYGEDDYCFVLDQVGPDDVVLDIGAGDLRLALRLAEKVRRVYAVEANPRVLGPVLAEIGHALPRNLIVICGNALDVPFPADVTVGVLLMRHCRHFRQVVDRLRAVGCRRLVTNARWRMGVEVVDLAPGRPFDEAVGWYACKCGAVGLTGEPGDDRVTEVESCPNCR